MEVPLPLAEANRGGISVDQGGAQDAGPLEALSRRRPNAPFRWRLDAWADGRGQAKPAHESPSSASSTGGSSWVPSSVP
jgi:hypothetical protein